MVVTLIQVTRVQERAGARTMNLNPLLNRAHRMVSSRGARMAAGVVAVIVVCGQTWAGKPAVGGRHTATTSSRLPTTSADYFQTGTQPLGAGVPGTFTPLLQPTECATCHS